MRFSDLSYGARFKIINTITVDSAVYERIKPEEGDIPLNLAKNIQTGNEIVVCADAEVVQLD